MSERTLKKKDTHYYKNNKNVAKKHAHHLINSGCVASKIGIVMEVSYFLSPFDYVYIQRKISILNYKSYCKMFIQINLDGLP